MAGRTGSFGEKECFEIFTPCSV